MTAWTEERIARAAALWREGRSASHIGAVLGVSRNAIVGIATRNRDRFAARATGRPQGISRGLKAAPPPRQERSSPVVPKPAPETALYKLAQQTPAQPVYPKRSARTALPCPPVTSDLPVLPKTRDFTRLRIEGVEPVAFAALTSQQCHFPLQAFDEKCTAETPHCGAALGNDPSYCWSHAKIVRGPSSERVR